MNIKQYWRKYWVCWMQIPISVIVLILLTLWLLNPSSYKLFTLTKLADGSTQFDWGRSYHSRSGFDDREWSPETYRVMEAMWVKQFGSNYMHRSFEG